MACCRWEPLFAAIVTSDVTEFEPWNIGAWLAAGADNAAMFHWDHSLMPK